MIQLRNAALIALAGSIGALTPLVTTLRGISHIPPSARPILAVLGLLSLVLPILYLALYRDYASVKVPVSMRPMALIGLSALGLTVLSTLMTMFPSGSVVETAARPDLVGHALTLTGYVSQMLLLVVLFRVAPQETPALHPSSAWLRWSSWAAVAAYGLVFVLTVAGLVAIPYTHARMVELAARYGQQAPTMRMLFASQLPIAAAMGGTLMTPFIIASSLTAKPSPSPE